MYLLKTFRTHNYVKSEGSLTQTKFSEIVNMDFGKNEVVKHDFSVSSRILIASKFRRQRTR